jgi:hypothetical protein
LIEEQTGAAGLTFFGSPLSEPERARPRPKRTAPGRRKKK